MHQCPIKACFMIAGSLMTSTALAHPHSFIDLNTTIIVEQQTLTGLRMVWVMDELTSADLLYDAKRSKDSPDIWRKMAEDIMQNVVGSHYFTEVYRDGVPVKYSAKPIDYQLVRQGNKAVLSFTLPLAKAQPLQGMPFTISTFEPSFYVDMRYQSDQDIQLPNEVKDRCTLTLISPKPNQELIDYAESLDLNDTPEEDMNLGQQFAQKVTFKCQ